MYPTNLTEEALKNRVAADFFGDFSYEPLSRIDLALTHKNDLKFHLLWAEAKSGENSDLLSSFTQLIFTIRVEKLHKSYAVPEFLGAFDARKIAFLPYKCVDEFLDRSDFNWKNITPSDHAAPDFARMRELLSGAFSAHRMIFEFAHDSRELRDFIKNSLAKGKHNPIEIDEENFNIVYLRWYNAVLPSIDLGGEVWKKARERLIALESDFFLADLLSENNKTINEKLRILLEYEHYDVKIDAGLFGFNTNQIRFKDGMSAHTQFWQHYKRPPAEKFWSKIIARRDKLAPRDIMERKGAFFTPHIWAQKAQDYLAQSLGENWQDEYYIWDCAAGTGNLLLGVKNPARVFASTLDLSDVLIMQELRKIADDSRKLPLLEGHIFQFDFLNDGFEKLPSKLQKIIQNEPEKLVIFINPPYAEVSSYGEKGKARVNLSNTHTKYKDILTTAARANFDLAKWDKMIRTVLALNAIFSIKQGECEAVALEFGVTFPARIWA